MIETNTVTVRKKDWVKNAIIIFLVLMLILTFFSNTIMNYSLPEVSAQYAKNSTISEQIRGSGTIEASDTYEVKIDETRTIETIHVKVGDVVEKGQLLLTLNEKESEELETAQADFDKMNLKYQQDILKVGKDYTQDYLKISRFEEDIETTKQEINEAKKELKDFESNKTKYEKAYEKAKDNTSAKNKEIKSIEKDIEYINEQIKYLDDEESYPLLNPDYYNLMTEASNKVTNAAKNQKKWEDKVAEYTQESNSTSNSDLVSKRRAIEEQETNINTLYNEYYLALGDDSLALTKWNAIQSAELNLKYLREDYSTAVTEASANSSQKAQINSAKNSLKSAETAHDNAKANLITVKGGIKTELKQQLRTLEDKKSIADDKLLELKEIESEAQENTKKTTEDFEKIVEGLETDLLTKQRDLEDKKVELSQTQQKDAVEAGQENLTLKADYEALQKQEELVKKLKEKASDPTVKAQVSGTISSINCTSGGTTKSVDSLMSIEVTELGYSLSFRVTNEQAKKIKTGDIAEVQYFWYGDAEAKVKSIKPDTSDPTQYKMVTFAITGDVSPGQSIQLALGGKGQNYDVVVPNSSIREDNNGKFILAVVAKSSPLGNRYIAERIDVTVLATDGTNSAVSGNVLGSEFVITNASKPIKEGMQVRMASN